MGSVGRPCAVGWRSRVGLVGSLSGMGWGGVLSVGRLSTVGWGTWVGLVGALSMMG